MIPLTTLSDKYIDLSKLTEQKSHLSMYVLPLNKGRNK